LGDRQLAALFYRLAVHGAMNDAALRRAALSQRDVHVKFPREPDEAFARSL
jgi:hypothetical protein